MPQVPDYAGSPLYPAFYNPFYRNTSVPSTVRFNSQVRNMSDHDLHDPASTRPASAVDAKMSTSRPSPLAPASSSIPGVAKPVSCDGYESDIPCMSGAAVTGMPPAERTMLRSPSLPLVPDAPMSPVLLEEPVICQRKSTYHGSTLDAEDGHSDNDEDDDISDMMTESSSETIDNLSHTADDGNLDILDVENGSDGVIDLQVMADHNTPGGPVSRGIDVKNSLRIDKSTGKFYLGPQWQVPSADAARMNAGPEFGTASTWTMSSYHQEDEGMMDTQDERSADPHLADHMGAIHLEDVDQAPHDMPTETSPNRTGLTHRLPPMPIDLSMSGARQSGPSFHHKK
ncbi:hypothetical protein F5B22DRAFT_531711 [Xylaria bambusicola]|uniref:uncharacterized protein n=1 Tax=Xylaria bambusicola TaxID=326684 RepID=UPI0020084381|nr:uncharacterized protein F5B22DRAFT_531711 [Xylaria bambusicola]KAI0505270.1 hypothetical protein F5B22DRAFT_531711 [Xylaria bambusicola]